MKLLPRLLATTLLPWSLICLCSPFTQAQQFRPPAVPLVAHDPYFSIWSFSDKLTDKPTRHWTGKTHSLTSLARIDSKVYRLMGGDAKRSPALDQVNLSVMPTRTIYDFKGAGISVTLTFLTPSLPDNLDVLSRPATYVIWDVRSDDGKTHDVQLYLDAGSEIVVDQPQQLAAWSRYKVKDIDILRMGSEAQPILQKSGDDLRIDWGYLYLTAPPNQDGAASMNVRPVNVEAFTQSGSVPDTDDLKQMKPYAQPTPVLAYSFNLKNVTSTAVSRYAVLAYDDLYSVEYFNRRLRPYWRRNGAGPGDLIASAMKDYDVLRAQSKAFDEKLMADLEKAGGAEYAKLCALAYRQTWAAHKLVADLDGTPLLLSKENFSNGSIDTVDITYPSSPFFLLLNPAMLKAQVQPILDYSRMTRWKFPFAPHDLGRYPLANGQQYGKGEESEENQMPVEESGNMLLMIAAMEQIDGNHEFAKQYWDVLTKWADYLVLKGLDPENQLCTDDFAGHLAHNANLSIKAILALGAYGKMAAALGHADVATKYNSTAKEFASKWMTMARSGDHYRLAFDRPETWSQKYNLVWDDLLGLKLFPRELTDQELLFYNTHTNKYGIPLDNRAAYTKIDWLTWTASLTKTKAEFEKIFSPAYRFANETPSRVPLSDWYDTETSKMSGFQARSVVGGLFIQMLHDQAVWSKYAKAAPKH